MTLSASRRPLPMVGHTRGTRSAATCHYKCGDACLRDEASSSTSPAFHDVVEKSLSRRSMLVGLGVVAGVVVTPATSALTARPAAASTGGAAGMVGPKGLSFTPIAPVPATIDALTVPEGYDWKTIIAWGDPVVTGAPAFDLDHQSAEAQEMQFGYNCDYLAILPWHDDDGHALMVSNHEYTNENLMFPGFTDEEALTPEQLRTSIAAHGLSVVKLQRDLDGFWTPVDSDLGRRFTGLSTVFELRGPAAGSNLVTTAADPSGTRVIGTLNNCAGGTTPWGTVLAGEENFDQYFRGDPQGDLRNQDGYGLLTDGVASEGRYWWKVDERFDTARTPNEFNRFGWVVEVDPWDPSSTPVKHTAMGRFKHEGATTHVAGDGRVVAYMGDDTRGQHLYKFVSKHGCSGGKGGSELLDEGDLYVAKFYAEGDPAAQRDGTGDWIALTAGGASQVPGFTLEEVLVYTREAAAAAGATPMDRPEDVEPDPRTGYVYIACTNNTDRKAAEPANPRVANKFGHVVELREHDDDATGTHFDWSLLLVCGDPADPSTYFSGFPADAVSPISCPDNVAFDRTEPGLWISTDGSPGTLKLNDALHYVPTEGPERGRVSQFLAVPTGAETCGPWVDAADGSVFVNVQHPGEADDALVDAPASRFPYTAASQRTPRPATVHVRRR